MPKIASRILKIALAVAAPLAVVYVGLPTGLSYYDSHTKDALLRVAVQELPPRASHTEMTEFMRRHTERFGYDGKYLHGYAGFVPQSRLDKFFFDRKVQMLLNVNQDQTFRDADVRVFYTFL